MRLHQRIDQSTGNGKRNRRRHSIVSSDEPAKFALRLSLGSPTSPSKLNKIVSKNTYIIIAS